MTGLKKHIAFFLFVFFCFSITFQSVHVVWHHFHGGKSEHYLCHQKLFDKDSHNRGENILEVENTCLLCEYQFSINDLPKIPYFTSIIPVLTATYNKTATQQQYKQIFSDKTPRAPPIPNS